MIQFYIRLFFTIKLMNKSYILRQSIWGMMHYKLYFDQSLYLKVTRVGL